MGDWHEGPGGRWVYDPNAPEPARDPTSMMPRVPSRDEYVAPVPRAGDIGDWIDPNAPDPTSPEVTDPNDPNYVHPWFGER